MMSSICDSCANRLSCIIDTSANISRCVMYRPEIDYDKMLNKITDIIADKVTDRIANESKKMENDTNKPFIRKMKKDELILLEKALKCLLSEISRAPSLKSNCEFCPYYGKHLKTSETEYLEVAVCNKQEILKDCLMVIDELIESDHK